jgi:hypothetical protein
MRVRAKQGGKGSFSWRTRAEKDFIAENSAAVDWPTSAEWQEVKVELPVKSRLMHLRITPAKESVGLEVRSITLAPAKGPATRFDFENSVKNP